MQLKHRELINTMAFANGQTAYNIYPKFSKLYNLKIKLQHHMNITSNTLQLL